MTRWAWMEAHRFEEADEKEFTPLRGGSKAPCRSKWIAARVQIGTAKEAKSVLHLLAQGHHQIKPARSQRTMRAA
ncbi:MAG: hypothetical protein NT167_23950 [Verrucomicrobia bacterium]|nr:hypothetical protein [Verrucomicrobiota bacterium]